jgi:hypothetical protein
MRFCLFGIERRIRLSDAIRMSGGNGGPPVMLDLPREQFEHDERFHREIVRLNLVARLKHMALHFCKYTGQFAAILHRPDDVSLRIRTITDSFIISLCSANALNFNLSEHIAPNIGVAVTLRNLGIYLAHQLYPTTKLDSEWLLTAHATNSAKMAAACEKIDHLEAFAFRDALQEAVLRLCQIAIISASAYDIDLVSAVRARRKEIQKRNLFITDLHQISN